MTKICCYLLDLDLEPQNLELFWLQISHIATDSDVIWYNDLLRYGSEIITWSTETIETGWLEEGSNGVKYTQSPKLPTGTFLHLDLNVTSMLGDNLISGHRYFHVNLTSLSIGPRPTRVKSWSLIELEKDVPYQHKSYIKFRTF